MKKTRRENVASFFIALAGQWGGIFLDREYFGFSIAVPAWLFAPKPGREESAFPLCTLLAFFKPALPLGRWT
ncbi:hypothetical protein AB6869_15755 [Rahnella rivi]|uniref:hypothetical protein n=1 Tax=Rahnella rivi TaxID=2816249 RepID=UPI0039BE159B